MIAERALGTLLLLFGLTAGPSAAADGYHQPGAAIIARAGDSQTRAPKQVRDFRNTHPCPATRKTTGACPGWVVDHVYPLCAGGKDHPENMQWQDTKQSYIKDRLERDLCRCKGAKAP